MKTLLAVSLLLAALTTNVEANSEDLKSKMTRNLIDSVKANCEMPTHMAPYTMANFERYVAQLLYPELKMLSTAFLHGFSTFESKNLERGYCVIVFLGLPNDPDWEKNFSFYSRAEKAGKLPTQMFAGFDDNGNVLLQPVYDQN